MIGIVKPADGVQPFNKEPGTDPTVCRSLSFVSLNCKFEIKLEIPIYINDALKSEDWDFINNQVSCRADDIRRAALLAGTFFIAGEKERINDALLNTAKQAVRNQFLKY